MIPFFTSDKGRLIKYVTRAIAAEITRARIASRKVLSSTFLNAKLKSFRNPELSDFDRLVYVADIKRKPPHAYNEDLDKLGFVFGVTRRSFETDEAYRQRIRFSIKSSTTKKGIKDAILFTVSNSSLFPSTDFDIEIRESISDFFDGALAPLNAPLRGKATLIGGITIYIRPKAVTKTARVAVDYLTDGTPVYDTIDYKVVPSIDYLSLVDYTNNQTLKSTLEILVSAGIVIDRVIFEQPGASGNKGEFYSFFEAPGKLRS